MFCVNCFNSKTSVGNSRPLAKQPAVWRRRACSKCKQVFTTFERPSLADNKQVEGIEGSKERFNLGRLIISISRAFSHNPSAGKTEALWLAQTVENTLSTQSKVITTDVIAATTHQVLKRYDELAAVQYAAQHQLISTTRRRPGRPSIK